MAAEIEVAMNRTHAAAAGRGADDSNERQAFPAMLF